MRASEFIFEDDEEIYNETAKMVWGVGKHSARGGAVKLKFRCTVGPRASRQVSDIAKCSQPMDIPRAQKMKTIRARTAPTQSRRQQRTKSINTASTLAVKLNNPGKSKQPKPWY